MYFLFSMTINFPFGFRCPLTDGADPGRRSSDAGGGDAVLPGAGVAQLGGSSCRDLWGSWGGVG